MKMQWIKLATDIFEDWKIKVIENRADADSILVIWFKLLTFAGKEASNGVFAFDNEPITVEMFAMIFNRDVEIVKTAFEVFAKLKMIEYVEDDTVSIPKWEDWQAIEGMDKVREQNRQRASKYRTKKTETQNDVTLQSRYATVTQQNDVTLQSRYGNALEENRIDKNREEENRESLTREDDVSEKSENANVENSPCQYFVQKWQSVKDAKGHNIFAVSGIENYSAWSKWWQDNPDITKAQIDTAFDNIKDAVDKGLQDRKYIPKTPDRFVLKSGIFDWQTPKNSAKNGLYNNKPQLTDDEFSVNDYDLDAEKMFGGTDDD